jgi:hypothetical protein
VSFAVHQLPESPFQGIGVPQSPQQACFALKTLTVVDAGLQPLALVKVDAGLSDGYGNGCGHHHTLPEDADGSLKINDFVSYRGIENPYGRARQWLDGVNVYLLDVYVSNNPADWQQRTTEKYCWVGNLPPTHTFLPAAAQAQPAPTQLDLLARAERGFQEQEWILLRPAER